MSNRPIIILDSAALDLEDIYLLPPEERQVILKQIQEAFSELQSKNKFYEELLDLAGFDMKILETAYEEEKKLRLELKEELESEDELVRESAEKKLSDATVKALIPIVEDHRYKKEKAEYNKLLMQNLSSDVWSKLSEESKSFLSTAWFTYDQLQNGDFNDYSAVCMLITKAVENEATVRYFDRYIAYLESNNIPRDNWPVDAIVKKNIKTNEFYIIKRDEFTLGSVIHAAGIKNRQSYYSKIDLRVVDETLFDNMRKYYVKKVLSPSFNGYEDERVMSDCSIIEAVRLNYRNPSAHKGTINKEDASRCIEYLLTKEKKLVALYKDVR